MSSGSYAYANHFQGMLQIISGAKFYQSASDLGHFSLLDGLIINCFTVLTHFLTHTHTRCGSVDLYLFHCNIDLY